MTFVRGVSRSFSRLLRHPVAQNALALYGVQLAGYILPLATLPYLARVLGPQELGRVVFAQSFAAAIAVLIEFGFGLSAVREVARHRADSRRVERVVAGVLGAKFLLAVLVGVLVSVLLGAVPTVFPYRRYGAWAVLMAVAMGMSPFWFFQGIERMRGPAAVDLVMRAVGTLGIFILVHNASDGWRVLAVQGGAGILASAIPHVWIWRTVRVAFPKRSEVRDALRMSVAFFAMRAATTVYTAANGFILGLLALPAQVAFFGGAERLSRGVVGLLGPASHALYPRMSQLMASDRRHATRLIVAILAGTTSCAVALGCALFFGAPLLVRWLLGAGYEGAVTPLKVLSALLPLTALNTVLGLQWMLPVGMERVYTAATFTMGALNVFLALTLVPSLGAIGMAVAVVLAEGGMSCFIGASLLGRSGLLESVWKRRGR